MIGVVASQRASNATAPGERCDILVVPRDIEMRTFDALAPSIRRHLAAAPFNMSATRIAPIVAKHGEAIARKVIDHAMRIFAETPP